MGLRPLVLEQQPVAGKQRAQRAPDRQLERALSARHAHGARVEAKSFDLGRAQAGVGRGFRLHVIT